MEIRTIFDWNKKINYNWENIFVFNFLECLRFFGGIIYVKGSKSETLYYPLGVESIVYVLLYKTIHQLKRWTVKTINILSKLDFNIVEKLNPECLC